MITKLNKVNFRRQLEYAVLNEYNEHLYTISRLNRKIFTRYDKFVILKDSKIIYEILMYNLEFRGRWKSKIINIYNEEIANVYNRFRRVGFTRYAYYEFVFKNRLFECFLVSIEGSKILIFEASTGKQVGLSEAPAIVRNNLTKWTIYAKNELDSLVTLFTTLVLDYREFGNKYQKFISKKYHFYTPNEIKSKYQPSFKDLI